MSSIMRARNALTGRGEEAEVIGGVLFELKVAGPSMLGIGCPDRHPFPLTHSPPPPKMHPPRRRPPARAGSFHAPFRSLVAGNRDGEKCSRAVIEPGTGVRRYSWEAVVRWRALGCQRSAKRDVTGPHHHGGRQLPNRLTVSGVPSQGDGQGESRLSNLDGLALCLDVLPPAPPVTALITVQTGHDGGQLVEQAGGRPCQSSTFRFIPLIEIIP